MKIGALKLYLARRDTLVRVTPVCANRLKTKTANRAVNLNAGRF
jgi:hypothetical protein